MFEPPVGVAVAVEVSEWIGLLDRFSAFSAFSAFSNFSAFSAFSAAASLAASVNRLYSRCLLGRRLLSSRHQQLWQCAWQLDIGSR